MAGGSWMKKLRFHLRKLEERPERATKDFPISKEVREHFDTLTRCFEALDTAQTSGQPDQIRKCAADLRRALEKPAFW